MRGVNPGVNPGFGVLRCGPWSVFSSICKKKVGSLVVNFSRPAISSKRTV
jgi:hypothetical protein